MSARRFSLLSLALLSVLGLSACDPEPITEPPTPDPNAEPEWPTLAPGALMAGASGGYLDIPVGVPLGGYTGRDNAFGGDPGPDSRDSDYTTDFQASGGWQTAMPLQVIWLTDGGRHAVVVRLDLIYSWDEMTEEIGRRLSAAVGVDLTDSVFTVTSHSHSAPGTFTNATIFFLGSDMFSREIFERMVDSAVAVALEAHQRLVPAKAGLGIDLDFDPIGDDAIFRDRREENDALLGPGDQPTGAGWKDQRASMLRVDTLDDEPIAALFAFGIHGTIMGGSNPLMTSEAAGAISTLLGERYGGPLWMFAQGAGGDASPSGRHSDFARMDYLAEESAERLLSLYESIELSADPIVLEPLQRYVPQNREAIKVTRNGTVNLEYEPWDESWVKFPPFADEIIYEDDGQISSPIDEFWAQHGAALCADPTFTLPTLGLDVDLPVYKSCIRIENGYILFRIAFQEYFQDRETSYPLPLPCAATAMLGALGMRSLPVTTLGGEAPGTVTQEVVFAFAPGEPTTLWTQFLRHRAATERDIPQLVVIGYAMDHEGYLLTADDWLVAGYEPAITVWGPLQGEAMLERFLDFLPLALTPGGEDASWPDWPGETVYPVRSIPTVVPDPTPLAGGSPATVPEQLYVRQGAPRPTEIQPAASLRRLQDVARFTFFGNDPAMGNPRVVVEREESAGVWTPVLTPAGNPIDDRLPDIIVTYTPQPLTGTAEDPDPVREHIYLAEWQALSTWGGLEQAPALPLGTYRLAVSGRSRVAADTEPPFDGEAWSGESAPFEVLPADVALEILDPSNPGAVRMQARYVGPPMGFRLTHQDADRTAPSPLRLPDGTPDVSYAGGELSVAQVVEEQGWTRFTIDASALTGGDVITIDDGYGNVGTVGWTGR